MLPGDVAFKLYDTYGFPLDMTEDILREDDLQVDREGFDACMEEQRRRAREARKAASETALAQASGTSRFLGSHVEEAVSEISSVYRDGVEVEEVHEGDEI